MDGKGGGKPEAAAGVGMSVDKVEEGVRIAKEFWKQKVEGA